MDFENEIDKLIETFLFDDVQWLRLILQELGNDGIILPEEIISLVQSLVE
jgi:hypothetical protein